MLCRAATITAIVLSQSFVAWADHHEAIPERISKQIDQRWIGAWDEIAEYDGKKEAASFSWKWGKSKNVVVSNWVGPDFSATGVGYWDAKAETFVMQGTTSRGDYWTTRWEKPGDIEWTGRAIGYWDGKPWTSETHLSWPDNNSYTYKDTTHGKPFVAKGKRAQQIDAEKALRKFGNFMKGTWTRTDDGFKREHHYTWALKRKFMRTNNRKDPNPMDGYIGIDQSNGKLGWWGFFADTMTGVIHLTAMSDGRWVFSGIDHGPEGRVHRKLVVEKASDNKLHAVVTDTNNGQSEVIINESWEKSK